MADGKIIVEDNADQQRYEVFVDGDRAGYAAYRVGPGRIVFTHTTIDPDYEGQGVGSALARSALDDARAKQLAVVAQCPFIAAFLKRHSEYHDLVEQV